MDFGIDSDKRQNIICVILETTLFCSPFINWNDTEMHWNPLHLLTKIDATCIYRIRISLIWIKMITEWTLLLSEFHCLFLTMRKAYSQSHHILLMKIILPQVNFIIYKFWISASFNILIFWFVDILCAKKPTFKLL